MARTADRPLPAGRLSNGEVIAFGAVTIVRRLVYLALAVNRSPRRSAPLTWVLVRLDLHAAQAPHAAQHGRRGRGRRAAGADGLGGGRRLVFGLLPPAAA